MTHFKYLLTFFLFTIGLAMSGCISKNDTAQNLASATEYYTCPMHPSVRSDRPGVCPICHMTLVKVSAVRNDSLARHLERTVDLTTVREVLANVTTARAAFKRLNKEISVVGKIDYAEPNAQQITTRFSGRIERLSISFVGQYVRRGDAVAEIYSPDAISAQREFLVAIGMSQTDDSLQGAEPNGNGRLIEHARQKLRLWGFTDEQIKEIATSKSVKNNVTLYSPISGTVLKKNVDLQGYVSEGAPLFDVADLSTVWLQVDVYESDISSVHLGQRITATIDAFPSEEFDGSVSFVSPVMESSTRTVRVRATLDNRTHRLKPEMYARAIILVTLPESIVVPASAVIETGKHTAVWTEVSPGRFVAREVRLGERVGDTYQVLSGLRAGETFAVTGGYLIDSESQLEMATMTEHKH